MSSTNTDNANTPELEAKASWLWHLIAAILAGAGLALVWRGEWVAAAGYVVAVLVWLRLLAAERRAALAAYLAAALAVRLLAKEFSALKDPLAIVADSASSTNAPTDDEEL